MSFSFPLPDLCPSPPPRRPPPPLYRVFRRQIPPKSLQKASTHPLSLSPSYSITFSTPTALPTTAALINRRPIQPPISAQLPEIETIVTRVPSPNKSTSIPSRRPSHPSPPNPTIHRPPLQSTAVKRNAQPINARNKSLKPSNPCCLLLSAHNVPAQAQGGRIFRVPGHYRLKKAWIFPGQKCRTFNVAPVKFSPEVRTDKILVVIRSVFMVGPRIDDESLLKYARFITTHQEDRGPEVEEIITQEVRKVSSRLTLDEIFFASLKLEDKVTEKVKELLIPLGLVVYSSSYKQFVDAIGLACCSIHNPREADVMHKLAEARAAQADADAKLAEARAMKASTDAKSIKLEADAKLYATLKEAECKIAMASSLEKARSVLGKDKPETSERTQIVLSYDVRLR